MEAKLGSILMGLASILVVTLAWRVLNWVWLRPKKIEKCLREQGFKGNSYKLLLGDSKDRDRMIAQARSKPMTHFSHDYIPRVLPYVHHSLNKYGERCIIWNDGPVPMVVIYEPELMRQIFKKMHEFQKPRMNPIFWKLATGLFLLEGEEWVHRRKLITSAFHMDKLKLMFSAFSTSTYDMIKKWEELTSKTGSCEVEVWSYLHQFSADVISRATFGSSYEEGRRVFELINEQILTVLPLLNRVYIPGWRFVPTKVNRRITQIDREIRALLKAIIQKRRKAISNGQKPKDDLLGTLLQSNVQDSIEELVNECKAFYLAGQDTTSALLVWTLILLGKHLDWQERARDEVFAVFGENNPDFQRLSHLKTMNMILQEVLRLYPPFADFKRVVQEDVKVGDISFPAGVLVYFPTVAVHQDEKLWGSDAKEFNPGRFTEGISKATGGNMSLFSFGWGPRICIGSNFAMIQAKMALAMILQRFSFELSPSYTHAPISLFTLRPQFGAYIIFHRL